MHTKCIMNLNSRLNARFTESNHHPNMYSAKSNESNQLTKKKPNTKCNRMQANPGTFSTTALQHFCSHML